METPHPPPKIYIYGTSWHFDFSLSEYPPSPPDLPNGKLCVASYHMWRLYPTWITTRCTCLSVCSQGGVSQHAPGSHYISSCTGADTQLVWRHHTGNIKCMMSPPGRHPRGRHPPPPPMVNERAVRILLECILV